MSENKISITGEPITDAMCRFTVDRPVYPDKSFAFLSKEAAEGSPLAQRLFEIDGVTRIVTPSIRSRSTNRQVLSGR